jgi:hypothetical protein
VSEDEQSGSLLQRLPSATRLLKEFFAPATLVTGVLFFFGWGHAY